MPEAIPSIGELDRRIELQRSTSTTDPDYNTPIHTYATYAEVWAKLEHHRSTEGEAAARQFAGFEGFFTIRHRTDVLANDRVVYEAKIYDVIGQPRELGRRQFLKVMVRGIE